MDIVLFDIDGTLLNTGGAGQAAMEAAIAAEFGTTCSVNGIRMAGRTDRAIVSEMFRYYQIDPDKGVWERFHRAYLHQLPRTLADRDGLVLPGIRELLRLLSAREHVQLGLLTGNFREGARIKLEYYEMFEHFEFGGYGDKHHDRDDVARDALSAACAYRAETVDPRGVLVIGDTPADVRCARAIDARAIAVATGSFGASELAAANPDHLFADFSDPAMLLQLLDETPDPSN